MCQNQLSCLKWVFNAFAKSVDLCQTLQFVQADMAGNFLVFLNFLQIRGLFYLQIKSVFLCNVSQNDETWAFGNTRNVCGNTDIWKNNRPNNLNIITEGHLSVKYMYFNPFPNKPWILGVCGLSFLKTL